MALALMLGSLGCESLHERVARRTEEVRAEFVGKRQKEVVAELGEPASLDEFRIGDGIGEFQIGLLNLYPPNDPATADRVIREARWLNEGEVLVLWLAESDGKWKAVDGAIMDTSVAY